MIVLVLSPYSERLSAILERHGDTWEVSSAPPSTDLLNPGRYDFAISHGYPHIVPPQLIKGWAGRLVNLHISLLPWNRGADPTFWSFFEATPKGVTIHHMDAGIDTGDVIAQRKLILPREATLASSYAQLQDEILDLFHYVWPHLREGRAPRRAQRRGGSVHSRSDIEPYRHLLLQGWDTPVVDIERAGREARKVS